ncbi:MAG: hypothetical protein KBC96_10775 [Armatimonadetes bacterium]|nr:hypothetical protein [Armatimonadota bacterium]
MAGTDSVRAVAERKVRFYQARMRGFIKDTGRLRQRDRERFVVPRSRSLGLPYEAAPNSAIDRENEHGTIVQRRVYGADGRPVRDIDLTAHGKPKTHRVVPHVHDWIDGERQREWRDLTKSEKRSLGID